MSWQATDFVRRQHIPDPLAKLVAMMLANYAGADGCAWPSIAMLAEDASQSERSVQRKLKILVGLGVVSIERDEDATTGRQLANRYRFPLSDAADAPRHSALRKPHAKAQPEGGEGDCQSPPLEGGGCPIVTGEGDTAVTPGGDTGVTPIRKSPERESRRIPPTPQRGEGREELHQDSREEALPPEHPPKLSPYEPDGFARLIAAYPTTGKVFVNLAAAQAEFERLEPADQERAIAAAAPYAAHCLAEQRRVKALDGWLRQRRFATAPREVRAASVILGLESASTAPAAASAQGSDTRVFVRAESPAWEAWQDHLRANRKSSSPRARSEQHRAEGWWFPSEYPPTDAAGRKERAA